MSVLYRNAYLGEKEMPAYRPVPEMSIHWPFTEMCLLTFVEMSVVEPYRYACLLKCKRNIYLLTVTEMFAY